MRLLTIQFVCLLIFSITLCACTQTKSSDDEQSDDYYTEASDEEANPIRDYIETPKNKAKSAVDALEKRNEMYK